MGIYVDVDVDGDFHILFFYFHFQLLLFYTVIPPVVPDSTLVGRVLSASNVPGTIQSIGLTMGTDSSA
jgi:hypothetical protein